jgi:hypothetical protein
MRASFPERVAQGELRTCGGDVPDKGRVTATHLRRQAFGLGWTPHPGRPEMTDLLQGLTLLPDGAPSGPVDIRFQVGLIAAIGPSPRTSSRRLLAMPALVNAHDHRRPLSPTSFGAAGKPLETWLLRLAAMPGVDQYLAAVAAFGRAVPAGRGR